MSKKFTLDRVEEDMYVFLEHPEEDNELIIPVDQYSGKLVEGVIVMISYVDGQPVIEELEEATEDMKQKVNNLLEKLKNKNQ